MKKSSSGLSLIEILVVLTLFTVVAALVNQAFFSTLRGSSKSKSTSKVKQEANFALAVMEREIHSAASFISSTDKSILYRDKDGNSSTIACTEGVLQGEDYINGYVSKNGEPLTSDDVNVTHCSFACSLQGGLQLCQVSLDVELDGSLTGLRPEEEGSVEIDTSIRFRNQ